MKCPQKSLLTFLEVKNSWGSGWLQPSAVRTGPQHTHDQGSWRRNLLETCCTQVHPDPASRRGPSLQTLKSLLKHYTFLTKLYYLAGQSHKWWGAMWLKLVSIYQPENIHQADVSSHGLCSSTGVGMGVSGGWGWRLVLYQPEWGTHSSPESLSYLISQNIASSNLHKSSLTSQNKFLWCYKSQEFTRFTAGPTSCPWQCCGISYVSHLVHLSSDFFKEFPLLRVFYIKLY